MISSEEKGGSHGCARSPNLIRYKHDSTKQGRKNPMMLKERQLAGEMEEEIREPVHFWKDKTPCWEMCHCPEDIKSQCPVPKYTSLPCWQIEGTYLKLSDKGEKGDDIRICRVCRVYKKYGNGKPIDIKLRGKGLDSHCRALKEKCQECQVY
jgi:hypothetical protein